MRRRTAGIGFTFAGEVLAALGLFGALSLSMVAHPLLALAQGAPPRVINGCTIVANPTLSERTVCPNAPFSKADLSGLNLSFANLTAANLTNANLSNANLQKADLTRANLAGANLDGATTTGANFDEVSIFNTTCPDSTNSSTNTPQTCVGHLTAKSCPIVANPTLAEHTECPNAPFSKVDLSGRNLAFARLTAANLTYSNLSGANLTDARLSNANLTGADLRHATLMRTNLNFGAKLNGANLTNANLKEANLTGANLTDANLDGATTTQANFDRVTWSNTTCPDGTNSSSNGGTCVGNHLR